MRIFLPYLGILGLFVYSTVANSNQRESRPPLYSDMRTTAADGIFRGIEGARVVENFEEGSDRPVSFTILIKGQTSFTMKVVEIYSTACGDHYVATEPMPKFRPALQFELVDYTRIRCRLYQAFEWQATLQHGDNGQMSELSLEGHPAELPR